MAGRSDFGGLVLGYIETKLCDQLRIFQCFLRSARLAHFCTTMNSYISDFQNICKLRISVNFKFLRLNFAYFTENRKFSLNILWNYYFFPELHEIPDRCRKAVSVADFYKFQRESESFWKHCRRISRQAGRTRK